MLDTNILSELRKERPHGGVLAWYAAHDPAEYAIPSIALYELQAGAERTRKTDPRKAAQIESWIEGLAQRTNVLSFDSLAARLTAKFMFGRSLDLLEDAMIASIASVHFLTLATRNIRDFTLFEVQMVNPFLFRST